MKNLIKKYFIFSMVMVFLFANLSIVNAEINKNALHQETYQDDLFNIGSFPINKIENNSELYTQSLFNENSAEIQPYVLPAIPAVVALIGSSGLRFAVQTYGRTVIKTLIKQQEKVARAAAKDLGYIELKNLSHGAKVYSRKSGSGPKYITRDMDSHTGGAWKGADTIPNLARKETRSGTYDVFLERIGD
ncbi:toxin C-terminal domain-containing protein [Lysinibacillus louembei]|uniref:Toxin C-terminal domain-containing protein n=1 Tax=Lysinibacillus louembei TaxID=1470088 RepID=A0ABZ0S0F9_9BACI|nr:toxin C-terminal domain-containing protein [Lysinibacillus louembei]WPK12741.1 toxin C-terminal domain-containing protein [Lysinibacillus louembei]